MRKKLMLGALVVAVLLIGLAVFDSVRASQKAAAARKLSDSFVSDVLVGNSATSYTLFNSDAQKNTSYDTWKDTVLQLSSFFNGQHSTFKAVEAHAGYRLYTYTITGSDGNYLISVVTMPQKNDWKVQSFNSSLQP